MNTRLEVQSAIKELPKDDARETRRTANIIRS
jgi:hypothetical protein